MAETPRDLAFGPSGFFLETGRTNRTPKQVICIRVTRESLSTNDDKLFKMDTMDTSLSELPFTKRELDYDTPVPAVRDELAMVVGELMMRPWKDILEVDANHKVVAPKTLNDFDQDKHTFIPKQPTALLIKRLNTTGTQSLYALQDRVDGLSMPVAIPDMDKLGSYIAFYSEFAEGGEETDFAKRKRALMNNVARCCDEFLAGRPAEPVRSSTLKPSKSNAKHNGSFSHTLAMITISQLTRMYDKTGSLAYLEELVKKSKEALRGPPPSSDSRIEQLEPHLVLIRSIGASSGPMPERRAQKIIEAYKSIQDLHDGIRGGALSTMTARIPDVVYKPFIAFFCSLKSNGKSMEDNVRAAYHLGKNMTSLPTRVPARIEPNFTDDSLVLLHQLKALVQSQRESLEDALKAIEGELPVPGPSPVTGMANHLERAAETLDSDKAYNEILHAFHELRISHSQPLLQQISITAGMESLLERMMESLTRNNGGGSGDVNMSINDDKFEDFEGEPMEIENASAGLGEGLNQDESVEEDEDESDESDEDES
ncbi:hypothetical protein FGRMN_8850 [Fusarium graminum]|nr:hypothetical protein FGRMN_8850 [Fusarium graminum]